MDFHIDINDLKLFCAIVVAGVTNGYFLYRKGLRVGWDNCSYVLSDAGLIDIKDDGEIIRVSDREYQKRKIQFEEE